MEVEGEGVLGVGWDVWMAGEGVDGVGDCVGELVSSVWVGERVERFGEVLPSSIIRKKKKARACQK